MHTLGVVSYRNSLPLWKPLKSLGANVSLQLDVPARLQAMLDARTADAALLPIADFLRHGGHRISDAGICADGPVRSVLVFAHAEREPQQWKNLALDTSSHTSVALTQVLLHDHWNSSPALQDHAPDFEAMRQFDAWLLIGDNALAARCKYLHDPSIKIYDLAEEWRTLTSLPFVFAAWIARADLDACAREELGDLLSLARNRGLTQVPALARESLSPDFPELTAEVIESYLTDAIGFRITERHRAAIDEFRARCERHGLA
jgi:chorismate dehydratase